MSATLPDKRLAELIDKQVLAVLRIEKGIAQIRSGQINPGLSMVAHAVWDIKYLLISLQATEVL